VNSAQLRLDVDVLPFSRTASIRLILFGDTLTMRLAKPHREARL